ncbi:MAG TPA: YihY/virulence factor BrkB family protein [Paracoccus sp. (in: a-proteobacteria)]|nr:YihY/virulence factor BrkB family protein [Paracoccus sp. (in: a-proteobacteria)]
MSSRQPDVYDALFGELPPGWRERKGLPSTPGKGPMQRSAGKGKGKSRGKTDDTDANLPPPPLIPGAPNSPWELSRASWIKIAKRVWTEFSHDRVTSVAGGVTFFGLLALFPAITALVSIYGLIADRSTMMQDLSSLTTILPGSAVDLIAQQTQSIVSAPATALSLAGVFSILLALWSANGGMKALIEALNVAWFEREKRGFIKLNLISLTLTLGAILTVILLIGIIAVVPAVLTLVVAGPLVENLVSILRWPLMMGVLLLGLAVIYRWGPNKEDAHWQWITPGAVLATVGLIVASMLFSWYAANFANYNKTYGSLGAAVVLMIWLWIGAIVVMTGAELNSEVERQIKIENGVTPKDDSKQK